jgi:hypothetical protein
MAAPDGKTIFTVREDGTGKTVLPASGRTPSWTPDGRVIFVSTRVDPPQIVIMDADGQHQQQIGNLLDEDNRIVVQPMMGKNGLVIFSDVQGAPTQTEDNPGPLNGTWAMQKDGSGLKLIAPKCTAAALALSGTWLTCTIGTENPPHRQIWRVNADGTELTQLTFVGDPNYPDGNASSISPDETQVAFFSGTQADHGLRGWTQSVSTWGHRDVSVIPAAGGSRRTITHCTPVTTGLELLLMRVELLLFPDGACLGGDVPAWTPDGKAIIYDRAAPNAAGSGTWVVNVDGSNNHSLWPDTRGGGKVPIRDYDAR